LTIFNLFVFNCKSILSRHMQYRFDFLIGVFVSLGIAFAQPVIQLIFYRGVNGFEGWNTEQIIVFQGVMMVWIGIKDTMFGRVRSDVQIMVRDGSFDRLLNKPYSPLVLIFSGGFNFLGIGPLLAGLVVLCYSINRNGINLGIPEVLTFMAFMISGLVLYMAILIVYCAVLIHLVSMNRLEEIMDKFLRFSEYPLNIYPQAAQWMLTLLLPLAVWIYYPSQTILHRLDKRSFICIAVSIILFFASLKAFEISLKKYSSAGG
jgi:ABC-2 type transport system permease protein